MSNFWPLRIDKPAKSQKNGIGFVALKVLLTLAWLSRVPLPVIPAQAGI